MHPNFYVQIYSAEGPRVDLQLLKPEHVIMHMVKFFSRDDNTATQPVFFLVIYFFIFFLSWWWRWLDDTDLDLHISPFASIFS